MLNQAACGRRAFPEDCGCVLCYLDKLGSNDSVEPDEVSEHLSSLFILHAEEVMPGCILKVRIWRGKTYRAIAIVSI